MCHPSHLSISVLSHVNSLTSHAAPPAMTPCLGTLRPIVSSSLPRTLRVRTASSAGCVGGVLAQKLHPACSRSRSVMLAPRCNAVDFGHQAQRASSRFQSQSRHIHHAPTQMEHRAFIALGSNMGDRVAMIERACREIEASKTMRIVRTSSLWETKAMYVLDQDKFVNGACEVCWLHVICKSLS